jgi:hypothetical protein
VQDSRDAQVAARYALHRDPPIEVGHRRPAAEPTAGPAARHASGPWRG